MTHGLDQSLWPMGWTGLWPWVRLVSPVTHNFALHQVWMLLSPNQLVDSRLHLAFVPASLKKLYCLETGSRAGPELSI